MAEEKIKWTQQQLRAITERGSDVLVSASAGTGKTAVLAGRCVDIVADKKICPDVWSILVLTFTNAAAEQMCSRIAEQLKAALIKTDDRSLRRHLYQQLMLLQGADISTIHSFCRRLITEYFYILGLDPTFRVIEADEQRLLKTEVLEKTIDWAWQQPHLKQGLTQLLYRRDLRENDGFLSKIIDAGDYLDSVVSRQRWYERAALLAETVNPFSSSLGEKQKQIVNRKLQYMLNRVRHAQKLYENHCPSGHWAAQWEETFVKQLLRCIELLKSGNWDECAKKIKSFDKPRVTTPSELDESLAEFVHETVKKAVDSFKELSDLAIVNPDYLDKVGGAVGLQTKIIIELVKKFDRLYSQRKNEINCLDFADLEHYALKLLTDESPSEDRLVPSKTALALRRKYKYIFVDEYQDINPVQQSILEMLSSERNVFVVGDAKQSIYAFRGAEPKIFIENLKSASIDPKNDPKSLRVDLNANWRSHKNILDFVNKIFGRVMTASFGKIDYDKAAELKPASADDSKKELKTGSEPVVELHILDEQNKEADLQKNQDVEEQIDENLGVYSGRQRQAAMIARRIQQMTGAQTGKSEFQIYDKKQSKLRNVEYRDIVVLMRSLAEKADFVEVFRLARVPVRCEAVAGYFEATEINDLICLLKVLDNPQRDIEFAAVLRSPFFKVSDTELARIKIHSRTGGQNRSFHDCVLSYCDSGPDAELADKLKSILAAIEQWRTMARRGDLADLIWQIYRRTNYLSFVLALPNGRWRRANLLKLHDRAIQFEGFASSWGVASLTRFVEFIEKLQEIGQDWASAEPQAQMENAVRIMSIHKSKGLEFPVVFLAELDNKFNKTDLQSDFLIEAADTVGLQIIDRQSNSKLTSLAHQVIAEEKLLAGLEEEMRILYVGTTRARERLVLTACEKSKKCRQIISNGILFNDKTIPDWQLLACQEPLEWVLYGLCDQKNLHEVFKTGITAQTKNDNLFSLKVYGQPELQQLNLYIDELRKRKLRLGIGLRKSLPEQAETKLLSKVKKSLSWQYQFGAVSLLPAKRSVTQLTHHSDEFVKIDYAKALQRQPKAISAGRAAVPVESQLKGTAAHLVITQLDLAKPVNVEAIEKTKQRLLDDNAITGAVAECIDAVSIMRFFENELGQAVLDAKHIWREWPFAFALPASELSNSSDEIVVVQGIIDMLAETNKGLLLIDFKTDNVTANEVPQRAQNYREQLDLYGRAAEAILKPKSIQKWLYFLKPAVPFEIK